MVVGEKTFYQLVVFVDLKFIIQAVFIKARW